MELLKGHQTSEGQYFIPQSPRRGVEATRLIILEDLTRKRKRLMIQSIVFTTK